MKEELEQHLSEVTGKGLYETKLIKDSFTAGWDAAWKKSWDMAWKQAWDASWKIANEQKPVAPPVMQPKVEKK